LNIIKYRKALARCGFSEAIIGYIVEVEVKMIVALRQKVKVQPGGQIEIRSPELEPGEIAEVIVLIEKQPTSTERQARVSELAALFKTTQALPQAQTISEEEIAAEIAEYRANKD
jgi:hypothetical protein